MSRQSFDKDSLESTDFGAEEGQFIDYDVFVDRTVPPPKTGEYYYQDYPYHRPRQSDHDRKEIKGSKLFDKKKQVAIDESVSRDEDEHRKASILVSGFGMRNVASFQKLIKMSHDEREKWELKKLWRDAHGDSIKSREEERMRNERARSETTETSSSTETHKSDFLTQTEVSFKTDLSGPQDFAHLNYLLGVPTEEEEEYKEPCVELETIADLEKDDFEYSTSKSVKEAQRYLRTHRIFECFQFIVAHLLSSNAENPIESILNLLNQCLLYRSGLGEAPLLYDRKHISKLFDLMDRLQSGVVDMQQYITGMKTLGICTFNSAPKVNDEGMVSRDTFIEEVYEAELAIFNDLIKKRPEKNKPKLKKPPKIFESVSIPSLNPPYFIPSDLFKFPKPDTNDRDDSMFRVLEGE